MASQSSEKSKGGLLSSICWLLGAGIKVSTLVVLLALLATVHQLRSTAEENSFKLEIAERELAAATSQQQDATRAYKDITSQMNRLQTDLANSRREAEDLQVQLSKKQDLQRDLDRKTQEAKSAKQESLVLSQKLQELEADVRRKEQEQQANQDTSSVIQSLESEKQQLREKVSSLEASLVLEKNAREAATGEQKSLTQKLQETTAKLVQAEKLREQFSAKEKAQDKKIEELREQVKKLENDKKAMEAELEGAAELAAQRNRALLELEEARIKITQSEKKEIEHSEHLLIAEISSRDEQIQQLSALVDVTRKKWTECDSAAKEKLSKLQKEKNDFESVMRDMFQQLDGKDKRIKELEEKAESTQNKLIDVEKTLTEKVTNVQAELRACLVADAESCAGPEGEDSCRGRADCSQLRVRVMDLEALLKSNEEQQEKLKATLQKTRDDWTEANEYVDEMRQKVKEAEKLARSRENMVESMREQIMRSAEITHGEVVQELRALAKEHDKLMKKYDDEVKPLQEKLEKARKGWLQNDKELVDLRKELKREKLRVSLCGGDSGRE